ncbi:hypothetical protein DFJ77DRAFT_99769 [Powellomyces hirtus]|nr:hypothetical protein DFJ77DRAFT_99769 [Powellomyces hirtus]
MVYVVQNLYLRVKMAHEKSHEALLIYYKQLSGAIKSSPLTFTAMARFLYDAGRDVNTVLQEDSGDLTDANKRGMERSMMLQGILDERYGPAVLKCKATFEGYICHIFETHERINPALSATAPEDLTDLRLAPSIKIMFTFDQLTKLGIGNQTDDDAQPLGFDLEKGAEGAYAPIHAASHHAPKRRRIGSIRANIDMVSKRPLTGASLVRQCTRCLHFARMHPMDELSRYPATDSLNQKSGLLELRLLERNVESWQERLFRKSCVCGGWWKEILNSETTAD